MPVRGDKEHEQQDEAVDGRACPGALRVERRAERLLDPAQDVRRVERHVLDEQRAEDDAEERAEPADDDADQEQERKVDRERVRVDEADDDRVERARRRPAKNAEIPNASVFVNGEVDARRDRGDLRLADRSERAPELALEQQPREHEHHAGDRPRRSRTPRDRVRTRVRFLPPPPPVKPEYFFASAISAIGIANVASAR